MICSPSDIPLHRFPERRQLFIMDDIIGKYRVDSVAVDLWRKLHDRLRVVFKDNNAKLLSTLRRQLYADMSSISFPTVFNSTIVDLESNHLILSSYEKKGMLENYLERKKITQHLDEDEKLRICSCHIAFPLLCNLFTSNQEFLKLKSNFFKSTSIIFKEELNRLQIENREVYCVLVILVIFHLEELQTIFDIDCDIERKLVFDKIIRACEVPDNICRRTLHRHLQSVAGTFVEMKHIFKFQHDKLEETIACHFGSQFPDIMLQYCKLDFIRDRVRLRSLPTDDENILILKQSSFAVFSKRVMDEITKGRFRDILLSQPMQCEKFIEYFAFFIKKNQIDLKDIANVSCNETILPPQQLDVRNSRIVYVANIFALLEELQNRKKLFVHWLAAMGCIHLFILFFKRPEKGYKHNFKTELLHLAVSGENIDVIKLLIDEGADLKSFDEFGIPLLCKIASTNRCDIAEFLIDKGADVDQADQILGWTPCFVAAWFNEAEMLSFLLSRGSIINEFDLHMKTPLVIALSRNNTQAVSVLLQNGAEIYDSIKIWNYDCDIPINFGFVLEEALNINNPSIIRMLTNNMKRRNKITMSYPVAIRKEDTSRRLLNIFLTEIKSDILRSPIWNDWIEICDAIYENDIPRLRKVFAKGDMMESFSILRGTSSIKHRKKMLATFDENYLRFCPLHVSAVCDNTKAAIILLQNGADPYQRDVRGRTSLHFATSRAMLKILLSTNDMPKCSKTYSLFNFIKLVIKFFFLFEFVPFLFKNLLTPKSDLKVNVTDIKGNTVIHAMIIRMSDPKKCLEAVETLIHKGADINIRCNDGYLPIDRFKTGSLRFEESLITRGERLLGGPYNKSFLKREKWYLIIWIVIFAVLYILLSFYISDMAFIKKETIPSSNILDRFYFKRMIYINIIYLIVMHQYWHDIVSITQAILVSGVGMTPIRKKLYSDKLFVRLSEKVGLVFLLLLFTALWFNIVHSTLIFFNAYCFIVCIFFCIMYIPNPCGNWIQQYRGILILSYKTSLMSCLGIWIFYLVLFIKFETPTFTQNIVEKSFNFSGLFLFLISKVIMFYIFFALFIFRLFRPLLFILFQPIYLYRHYTAHLLSIAYLMFLILEILLVPLIQISNC